MITLMTGGSACGKSSYAESLAVRLNGPRYYLAAMQPYGEGLTANEMFDDAGKVSDPYARVISGVEHVAAQCSNLIVITNDVGSDAGVYSDETMRYVRTLGCINIALAQMADNVYELVAGIPIVLKGKLI